MHLIQTTVVTASFNLFLVLFKFLKESSIILVSVLMMIALFSKLAFASTLQQVVCVCFCCIFLNLCLLLQPNSGLMAALVLRTFDLRPFQTQRLLMG